MNLMYCKHFGHEIVALANIYSPEECDSFMFQTVGGEWLKLIAEALNIPLYTKRLSRKSKVLDLEYNVDGSDETEDLYELLQQVLNQIPDIQGISSGAILSNYQRIRVENVASRLNLISYAYLWQMDQELLLREMVNNKIDARLVKVAAIGLNGKHLLQSIAEMESELLLLNQKFDLHVCGEGGEYETIVFDCPLYQKRIQLVDHDVMRDDTGVAWVVKAAGELVPKEQQGGLQPSIPPLIDDIMIKSENFSLNVDSEDKKVLFKGMHVLNSSKGASVKAAWLEVSHQLDVLLQRLSVGKDRVAFVYLFLNDMNDFNEINEFYGEYFAYPGPPGRACIEITGMDKPLKIWAMICHEKYDYLHVQSVSFWAPANIGPYSQCIKFEQDFALVSGQIPLIPSTMNFDERLSFEQESNLSLQHGKRILEAVNVKNVVFGVGFVVTDSNIAGMLQVWKKSFTAASCVIARVSALPKSASCEWLLFGSKRAKNCMHLLKSPPDGDIVRKAEWGYTLSNERKTDSGFPNIQVESLSTLTGAIQFAYIIYTSNL